MKRSTPYRLSLFFLLLLGALLLGQGAMAQEKPKGKPVGDPDKVLKNEKQKKKPKKKKRDDPDHSPRNRVWELIRPAKRKDFKPGEFSTNPEDIRSENAPIDERKAKKLLMREQKRKTTQPRGTVHEGRERVQRSDQKEPGTHYTERSEKDGRRASGSRGTQHEGNRTVKRKEVDEPGVVYDPKAREKASRGRRLPGTRHDGNLSVKKKEVDQPGVVYNRQDREKAMRRQRLPGTQHDGNQSVKRSEVDQPGVVYNNKDRQKALRRQKLPGTNHGGNLSLKKSEIIERGTHHADRDQKAGERYSSYSATRHAGNKSIKTKWVKEPGTHWSERKASLAKQYSSTPATSHEGNVRTLSARQKMRFYGDRSEKVHQFEGNLKLAKRDADMHPSVVARKSLVRSSDQKERARKRSNFINRIFTKKQQPSSVKAKPLKPRYDKGESEIWYE